MLEILDGLIATIAVVLLLSLVVQAVQQIVKQTWNFKSKYMERELVMMFLPDSKLQDMGKKWKGFLKEKITLSLNPLVDISADDRKIVEQLKLKLMSLGYEDLEVIETITVDQLKNIICTLPMFAGQDPNQPGPLKEALANVQDWFDITKKAYQDHYERKMKAWALALSALLVLLLNANLFEIYEEFSVTKPLRDAGLAMTQKLTSLPHDTLHIRVTTGRAETTQVNNKAKPAKSKIIYVKAETCYVKADTLRERTIRGYISLIQRSLVDSTFQILRWSKLTGCGTCTSDCMVIWTKRFFGWFSMALLVSLGAPFWYDFLKSVTGVKDYFKKPGSQTSPTK